MFKQSNVRIISFSWPNAPAEWTHVAGRIPLMQARILLSGNNATQLNIKGWQREQTWHKLKLVPSITDWLHDLYSPITAIQGYIYSYISMSSGLTLLPQPMSNMILIFLCKSFNFRCYSHRCSHVLTHAFQSLHQAWLENTTANSIRRAMC